MLRSRYELRLTTTVIESARTAVGKELPRYLPVMQEPPPKLEN